MNEHEYTGHLHIHSIFSDGSATVSEIAADAAKAGLDFITITDHNTLEGLDRGLEGRHEGVLVFFGTEINMRKNHYLAFGVREKVPQNEEDPQQVIDAVNDLGGFGYLAHPVEKSNPVFLQGNFYPWDKWDVSRFTGLEIWNFGSLWRSAFRNKLQAFFWYFIDPYRGARYPDPQGLALWDSLSREGPLAAFAGSDAHGIKVRFGPFKLKIFPYDFLFRTLNTHILLEEELHAEADRARGQVFDALRAGRFFIGSDYLGRTRGFRFAAGNGDKDEISMGQEMPFSLSAGSIGLHIVSPSPRGLTRIIKNGRLLHESRRQEMRFKVTEPGTYRVEVYRRTLLGRPLPWIYSNPIYLK